MSMFIGEALAGEGNEIAHIDLLIGSKDGPVGNAFEEHPEPNQLGAPNDQHRTDPRRTPTSFSSFSSSASTPTCVISVKSRMISPASVDTLPGSPVVPEPRP